MDPVATLALLLDESTDRQEAAQAAQDLRRWIRQGGFVPKGWTKDRVIRVCMDAICMQLVDDCGIFSGAIGSEDS